MEELHSLRHQLAQLLRNLWRIEKQEAEHTDPRNVPVDLRESKSLTIEKIEEVKARLLELDPRQFADEAMDVPFVIVAMIEQQACELLDEAVSKHLGIGGDQLVRFQQFMDAISEEEIKRWLSHYAETREDWRPHTYPDSTIQEIISETVADINLQQLETTGWQPIRPRFWSGDFFSTSKELRYKTSLELAKSGCVLVVDAVSLFHPGVSDVLAHYQMLSSNPKVATLVLSPFNPKAHMISRLLEEEVCCQMWHAFNRCEKRFDKFCEIGVGDLRGLRRWLFAILPEAAEIVQKQRFYPPNRDIIRELLGGPVGVERAIFGPRGGI